MITTHRTPAVNAFFAERDEQARCQEAINKVYADYGAEAAKLAIRLRAETDNASFSQYDGYWAGSDWTLAEAKQDLVSKGGDQALKGDVVLFRSERGYASMPARHEFYSVRLGWNCSAGYGVEPVAGWKAHFAGLYR